MSAIILPHRWKPRSYQMPCWQYFQGMQEGKRAAVVWHRRAGKDLFGINLVAGKAFERVGTYWHLLPTYKQGRSIVWNGFTRDGRAFLDHFHPDTIHNKNSTEMRVTFSNGANYQVVGTDDINSLVGTNPIGCIFSEYSLHDPGAWEYIRPILAENGGWALFIYTARGRNHGHTMMEMAKRNLKWYHEILIAGSGPEATKRDDGSPVISDEIIQEERDSNMPEAMIQQEFYCSFDAPFVGAYYGEHMMRIDKNDQIKEEIAYEPLLPVDTYWDIGVNDTTCIWFMQPHFGEFRVIDFYQMSGEGLPHYVKLLQGQVSDYDRMGEYVYRNHWAPWDISVREFSSGKSRLDAAKTLGLKFKVVKQGEVLDGIENVRNILPKCYFNRKHCQRGIEALRQYRKEWDDKLKTFKSHPLHDWTSNPADAFRSFAMSQKAVGRKSGNLSGQQKNTVDEHDYLRCT